MNPEIAQHGFAMVPRVLKPEECQELIRSLGNVPGAGRRGLLAEPVIGNLARSERLLAMVRPHLANEPLPVRGIYFDKSSAANWQVSWHQDLTVALCARAEHPGFGPWSIKAGIPHAHAPAACLEQMLTIRLHLDDANESNGALRVLPGSHRFGRLTDEQSNELCGSLPEHLCVASAGDALLMRPLLLHASSRSNNGSHRRVLHLEYAGLSLPPGLQWHEAA